MREITEHHDGHGLNESLIVECDDQDPNAGGASHKYTVRLRGPEGRGTTVADIQFQHGPRLEDGSLSGCTDQVLLAIVADRQRSFQAGPFGCLENEMVLDHVAGALRWLRKRADERAERGVLGKNAK